MGKGWLIECETCGYPENEGVEYDDQTGKAKPGKDLKEILHEIGSQIFKGLQVNFLNE